MRLHNTLTGLAEPVNPPDGVLRMYVCGVTPYDTTHLGHALTYTTFDVINRYFQYRGRTVRYIQNITDIDDDVLRKAKELGESWIDLGNRWAQVHIDSLAALNVLPPETYTRATEHIPMMIEIIAKLVEKQQAYQSGPNVYFRVASFDHYGELSKLPESEMQVRLTETGDPANDPNKESPLDFVLWLGNKPGEPAWESPWGPGRPGWHIECSAMAIQHLGPRLDIHGGGADLVYPHHENEIAQSESYSGVRPFARTWAHNGMLRLRGEKMSKSLGNLVLAQDLLRSYSSDSICLYLSGEHYRESFAFDESKLKSAQAMADQMKLAVQVPDGTAGKLETRSYRDDFLQALENDLDTPSGVATLASLTQAIQDAGDHEASVTTAQSELRSLAGILGLRLDTDNT